MFNAEEIKTVEGFRRNFGEPKEGMLLDKYKKAEYYCDDTPSYELIMRY